MASSTDKVLAAARDFARTRAAAMQNFFTSVTDPRGPIRVKDQGQPWTTGKGYEWSAIEQRWMRKGQRLLPVDELFPTLLATLRAGRTDGVRNLWNDARVRSYVVWDDAVAAVRVWKDHGLHKLDRDDASVWKVAENVDYVRSSGEAGSGAETRTSPTRADVEPSQPAPSDGDVKAAHSLDDGKAAQSIDDVVEPRSIDMANELRNIGIDSELQNVDDVEEPLDIDNVDGGAEASGSEVQDSDEWKRYVNLSPDVDLRGEEYGSIHDAGLDGRPEWHGGDQGPEIVTAGLYGELAPTVSLTRAEAMGMVRGRLPAGATVESEAEAEGGPEKRSPDGVRTKDVESASDVAISPSDVTKHGTAPVQSPPPTDPWLTDGDTQPVISQQDGDLVTLATGGSKRLSGDEERHGAGPEREEASGSIIQVVDAEEDGGQQRKRGRTSMVQHKPGQRKKRKTSMQRTIEMANAIKVTPMDTLQRWKLDKANEKRMDGRWY